MEMENAGTAPPVDSKSPPDVIDALISKIFKKVMYSDAMDVRVSIEQNEPGLVLASDAFVKAQHAAILSIIKQIGLNLLTGKNIMRVSLPVTIFEPRTMLMRIIEYYKRLDLIDKADEATDPLERFKYLCTFVCAGLHKMSGNNKPFNPILGETFECEVGGNKIFVEQTSHHPPVSTINILGGKRKWFLTGIADYSVNVSRNHIDGHQKGENTILFSDGTEGLWEFPPFIFHGLTFGKRWGHYVGNLVVRYPEHGLYMQVEFLKKQSKKKISPTDEEPSAPHCFRGGIYKVTENKEILKEPMSDKEIALALKKNDGFVYPNSELISVVKGSFLRGLWIDGKKMWEIVGYDRVGFALIDKQKTKEDKKKLKEKQKEERRVYKDSPEGKMKIPKNYVLPGIYPDDDMDKFNLPDNGEPKMELKPLSQCLFCDSRYRNDLLFLGQNNLMESQKWKDVFENIQRKDRALRADQLKVSKKEEKQSSKQKLKAEEKDVGENKKYENKV